MRGRERDREILTKERNMNVREKERRKHQLVASCVPPIGDLARNPGKCRNRESNRQTYSSQAGAQPTEPQKPGLSLIAFKEAN